MILNALLDQLDYQTRVLDIRVGLFHTAVLSRHCGLAASMPRDALRQSPPLVKEPGSLLNLNARELARLVRSESLLEAATGTAITNKSIEDLLHLCDPRAYVLGLGDSAPLAPLHFDLGINAICGTLVENPELAMSCVSQGVNFRQIRGTRRLTMLRP